MPHPSLSRVARTALFAGLFGAGGLVVAPAARAQEPKPFAKYSDSAEKLRDSLVSLARAQVGKKYVWGGSTPERGFDYAAGWCSMSSACSTWIFRARRASRPGWATLCPRTPTSSSPAIC